MARKKGKKAAKRNPMKAMAKKNTVKDQLDKITKQIKKSKKPENQMKDAGEVKVIKEGDELFPEVDNMEPITNTFPDKTDKAEDKEEKVELPKDKPIEGKSAHFEKPMTPDEAGNVDSLKEALKNVGVVKEEPTKQSKTAEPPDELKNQNGDVIDSKTEVPVGNDDPPPAMSKEQEELSKEMTSQEAQLVFSCPKCSYTKMVDGKNGFVDHVSGENGYHKYIARRGAAARLIARINDRKETPHQLIF